MKHKLPEINLQFFTSNTEKLFAKITSWEFTASKTLTAAKGVATKRKHNRVGILYRGYILELEYKPFKNAQWQTIRDLHVVASTAISEANKNAI